MTSQTVPTAAYLQELQYAEQRLRDGEIDFIVYESSRRRIFAEFVAQLIRPLVLDSDRDSAASLVQKSALRSAIDQTVSYYGTTGHGDAGVVFAWLAEKLRVSPRHDEIHWRSWDALATRGRETVAARSARSDGKTTRPPLRVFSDTLTSAGAGPEMVVIPAGIFIMGRPPIEEAQIEYRGPSSPQALVRFSKPFALGRYAVTVEQWRTYLAASGMRMPVGASLWRTDRHSTGCRWSETASWEYPGFVQGSNHPVVCVSWNDARGYCQWLSQETGHEYYLPTEAQWEYACRAGTQTTFHFGETIDTTRANYDGTYVYGDGEAGLFRQQTVEVGTLMSPNPWGLHDMHGNVEEWCEDPWEFFPERKNSDGNARPEGICTDDRKVYRGGSWVQTPAALSSASRSRDAAGARCNAVGFRVARRIED